MTLNKVNNSETPINRLRNAVQSMIGYFKSIFKRIRNLVERRKSSYAFLFNADYAAFGGWYGGPCEDIFLKSLFNQDAKNRCDSLLLRGDLIIYRRAEKYLGVSRKKEFDDKQSISWTVGIDNETYLTMFWDLVDSISSAWHTTDDEEFTFSILGKNTYVIYLPSISRSLAVGIDKDLKSFNAYYGAIEVDRGNPLHKALFDEQLIDDSFIKDGIIHTQKDSNDIPLNLLCTDNEDLKTKVIHLFGEDFFSGKPNFPGPIKISKRGAVTLAVLKESKKDSHYQNLAESLRDMASKDVDGQEFTFSIPKDFERVVIPREKLINYALNLNHPNGSNKAVLFRDMLGITEKHWKYLNDEIIRSINKVKLHKTRVANYGIQYHALIPVNGLNGQCVNIVTAWIVDKEGCARLTTLHVANKKDQELYK